MTQPPGQYGGPYGQPRPPPASRPYGPPALRRRLPARGIRRPSRRGRTCCPGSSSAPRCCCPGSASCSSSCSRSDGPHAGRRHGAVHPVVHVDVGSPTRPDGRRRPPRRRARAPSLGCRRCGSAGRYAGSDDVALAWVQAMADGDFQTAYDLCVRRGAGGRGRRGRRRATPPGTLAHLLLRADPRRRRASPRAPSTAWSTTRRRPRTSPPSPCSWTTASPFTLLVYVGADLTVCDFR